ncbi:hypothetical protein SMSP2_01604 [Limihaloglobus sulfuriphilus]|uniref:Guanylate cyclase domain-containing protein n=1 Tax=Limihaloglobus sulfuriphilus TaxID=1851148 RepID=A0A1Q2MFB1_9BACT|nr:hypothetical protein [Limihaloglobus sulfuriphilus]AQQ71238.1 hypothetical protein SMSP2_01604 [Limihaloglobus sulfuriphilus]
MELSLNKLFEQKKINPENTILSLNKSIFVWIDILGFSDALEKESEYKTLSDLLDSFRRSFYDIEVCESNRISDGIILILKQRNYSCDEIETLFQKIGEKQKEFILECSHFIRGGIAVGSSYEEQRDCRKDHSYLISSGLAKSVKIENSKIDWPIIGIDKQNLEEIRDLCRIENEKEFFGLSKCFNRKGGLIYFIDFMNHVQNNQDKEKIINILYGKVKEFHDNPKIHLKYVWLLRYYRERFECKNLPETLKGVII